MLPDESSLGTGFGGALDVSGNIAVVGAGLDGRFGESSGAAYLFDIRTGDLVHVLSSYTPGHAFGGDVAITGDTVLVGAELANLL